MVVVVVPALAERDEREERIVAAVVVRVVAAPSPAMRERVDRDGGVEQHDGRHEEAPDEHLRRARPELGMVALQPAAPQEQRRRERDRHEHVEAIEQAQLGEALEVAHARAVGAEAGAREEPAHVAAQEARARRMRIVLGVGVAMVVAVVRGPPERSALHAARADHAEHELHDARRAERAVREVAVVERGDREHAQRVQRERRPERDRRDAGEEHAEAHEVHADERHDAHPVDAVVVRVAAAGFRVEPAPHGECGAPQRTSAAGLAGCPVHRFPWLAPHAACGAHFRGLSVMRR